MPLPLLTIAIPVLPSSGAWIASTSAGGYIAGTLSSSWIGAFILGNSGLLSTIGAISGAGVFAASGGTGLLASAAAGTGTALTSIGLGGVASYLGIAPVTTFLGLTPVGWAVASSAAIAGLLGTYLTRQSMKTLNHERAKGGLEPITVRRIYREAKDFESQAMVEILRALQREGYDILLSRDDKTARIEGEDYRVDRLRYVIEKDGSEKLCAFSLFGRLIVLLLIKEPGV